MQSFQARINPRPSCCSVHSFNSHNVVRMVEQVCALVLGQIAQLVQPTAWESLRGSTTPGKSLAKPVLAWWLSNASGRLLASALLGSAT